MKTFRIAVLAILVALGLDLTIKAQTPQHISQNETFGTLAVDTISDQEDGYKVRYTDAEGNIKTVYFRWIVKQSIKTDAVAGQKMWIEFTFTTQITSNERRYTNLVIHLHNLSELQK